jgi:hypothetical protein
MPDNTHITFKASIKKSLISFGAMIVICALPFVVAWYGEDIEDWFEVRATSRKLPEAEIRYNAMIEQITDITEDTVLEDNIYSLRVLKQHYFTHCIRGGAYWTYGANRPFGDVVEEYIEIFTQMGWEHRLIDRARYSYHYFSSKIGRVRLEAVSPRYSSHSDQYQTTYEIDFSYAEPSRGGCSGG